MKWLACALVQARIYSDQIPHFLKEIFKNSTKTWLSLISVMNNPMIAIFLKLFFY